MDKLFVIFNPAARGEKTRRVQQFLETKAGSSVILTPTQRAGEAQSLAARAVTEGYKIIVAAGGDGTINEVVNGIGTSGVALGVLPFGTVNVFAHELRIPCKLEAAWAVILRRTHADDRFGVGSSQRLDPLFRPARRVLGSTPTRSALPVGN